MGRSHAQWRFEGLLSHGEHFAGRLVGAFSAENSTHQLIHIATDGESYGHHHRYGDMALASALDLIEANRLARLTNYGEYLDGHPPMYRSRDCRKELLELLPRH